MNPLSEIYGAASGFRNRLFDRGALKVKRLQQPVISVGNLSVGGAGKTPFVIALGGLLKARGVQIDVLSRGYGRRTKGVLVVDPGGTAREYGDEPLLIARRLGVPVIVGESRYEAGLMAERSFGKRLHLLDDGFQHRALARDFDIVLLSDSDFEDRLLPAGRLREPLAALKRADALVLPEGFAREHAAISGKLVWKVRRDLLAIDAPGPVVAFCGIARPEQFFAQLRASGIALADEVVFRDHHAYGRSDVEELLAVYARAKAHGFVTTEKDAVNLNGWQDKLAPLHVAELKVVMENASDVVDTLLSRIQV